MPLPANFCEPLIDATGTGVFSEALLDAADRLTGVEEIFAYWVDASAAPHPIVSAGRVGSAQSRADLYTSQFYRLDPLARQAFSRSKEISMARLVASDVQDLTYRRECYERPGISEKIAFASQRDGRRFVLNFYRRRDQVGLQIDSLSRLAQLSFPLLRKHLTMMGDELDLPILERLERRLRLTFPLLSARETQVCARTLLGMTAEAISLDLAVNVTTILTYRRRAYGRYNLSSAQAMIGKILF